MARTLLKINCQNAIRRNLLRACGVTFPVWGVGSLLLIAQLCVQLPQVAGIQYDVFGSGLLLQEIILELAYVLFISGACVSYGLCRQQLTFDDAFKISFPGFLNCRLPLSQLIKLSLNGDENQDIKIIDFGAANEFLGTATGTLVGKQAYLPMEQLRGKAVPQSDIYAFGGTLHFLLTGQDPEPLAVSHPRQQRPELSSEIDYLIACCTDPDYKKRPKSAAEILEKLMRETTQV